MICPSDPKQPHKCAPSPLAYWRYRSLCRSIVAGILIRVLLFVIAFKIVLLAVSTLFASDGVSVLCSDRKARLPKLTTFAAAYLLDGREEFFRGARFPDLNFVSYSVCLVSVSSDRASGGLLQFFKAFVLSVMPVGLGAPRLQLGQRRCSARTSLRRT